MSIESTLIESPKEDLATESAAAPPSMPGNSGEPDVGHSLSLDYLVVKGKAPIKPRPALESIIGPTDSRERVLDTALHPWRMICSLAIHASAGTWVGTGWFAGPRTVVTAGHCITHASMGGAARSIDVIPGRNVHVNPFGKINSRRFSTTSRWLSDSDPDYDIGCIHLDHAPDPHPGYFTIAALSPDILSGYLVNVAGYPADKGGDKMYHHANQVLRCSPRRVFYNVDTMGGQSGGPVWIHEQQDAPPTVIGIHAYGIGATPHHFGIEANSAPRVTNDVLELIRSWVKSDSD